MHTAFFRDCVQKCENCFVEMNGFSDSLRANACKNVDRLICITGRELYNLFSVGKTGHFTGFFALNNACNMLYCLSNQQRKGAQLWL